jgi:deazaflavin-dependent oxidoreductase (nitroreductase family)
LTTSALPRRRSAAWSAIWRAAYRFLRLVDPLIRSWIALGLPGLGATVEITTRGRRSGRPRRVLVTLLRVDDRWVVGHPNGTAGWIANAEAAGWVEIEPAPPSGSRCAVRRVGDGPEREAVIRATWRQQPFPANVLYRAAARHVAAMGVYLVLVPTGTGDAGTASPGG